VVLPHRSDSQPDEPDSAELAAQAAEDLSTRAFVEDTKQVVANGSIWGQIAEQTDLPTLLGAPDVLRQPRVMVRC
jgi:hypothetical protein